MDMTTGRCVDRMTSRVGIDSLSVEEPNDERNKGEGAPLKKGPWTTEEDEILKGYVAKYGQGNWSSVQRRTGLPRCGKSCRLRWANHLKPNLKKGPFTPEEEELIIELQAKIGNKWVQIAAKLPGRTDNDIKNFWNARLKRQERTEKYLDPPDVCYADLQNKELVTSSSANSDPAVLPNIEVELQNLEASQQLYPPALFDIGFSSFLDIPSTSLLDHGVNSSWNTSSVPSIVHPSEHIPGSESWFPDQNEYHNMASDYHSSFSGTIPVSHAPLYGNSASESIWEHQQELPSYQTPVDTWSSIHSPFVLPDACPLLRAIQWGINTDAISPSHPSITSFFHGRSTNQ